MHSDKSGRMTRLDFGICEQWRRVGDSLTIISAGKAPVTIISTSSLDRNRPYLSLLSLQTFVSLPGNLGSTTEPQGREKQLHLHTGAVHSASQINDTPQWMCGYHLSCFDVPHHPPHLYYLHFKRCLAPGLLLAWLHTLPFRCTGSCSRSNVCSLRNIGRKCRWKFLAAHWQQMSF